MSLEFIGGGDLNFGIFINGIYCDETRNKSPIVDIL